MDGLQRKVGCAINLIAEKWQLEGVGDFDGDGSKELYWRNIENGLGRIWSVASEVDGCSRQDKSLFKAIAMNWELVAIGDFNGDGRDDVAWRDTNSGKVRVWLVDGFDVTDARVVGQINGADWIGLAAGDTGS